MWILRSLSVGKKILGITVFLLCIIAGLIGYTVVVLNKQKDDANTINLAGAQRMLIQKMAKEANQIALGDAATLASLRESSARFTMVLNGLLSGDDALQLQNAQTPEISQKLSMVVDAWKPFHSGIEYILGNAGRLIEDTSYIAENNVRLFDMANDTVTAMGEEQSSPESVAVAGRLRALTQRIAKATLAVTLGKGETSLQELRDHGDLYAKILDGLMNGSEALKIKAETSPKVIARLKALREGSQTFLESVENVLNKAPAFNKNCAYINSRNLDLLKIMNDAVSAISAHSASNIAAMIRTDMFIIFPAALVIGLLVSFAVSRQITTPLRTTARMLQELSDGNFVQKQITVASRDEVGAMSGALNVVVKNLRNALSQVTSSAAQVASASEQISSSGQELAEASQSQASTLEEISATLEEMTSMTATTSDNAQQANALAEKTREAAERGSLHMADMVKSMDNLAVGSSKISQIIKTIDDIAFQTNLLALNAAVEAARAGEYGRGFAVVAEEVRNLAQKSASASRETSDLIESTVKQVEKGRTMSNQTAKSFGEIVEESKKTAAIVGEMVKAFHEQAQGISNINSAVLDIDKGIQRIATNAEESASASGELSDQARGLKNMLEQFKIQDGTATAARPIPARIPAAQNKAKAALPGRSPEAVKPKSGEIAAVQGRKSTTE